MQRPGKAVILIVDDCSANIIALKSLLVEKDRLLVSATNGEEALKLTLLKDIDLIILDVQMPGMDGFEVARNLKSNNRTKDIPIIFATAVNKDRQFIMRGYDQGAIDYLFKPLNPEILKAKVAAILKVQLQKKELTEKNASLQKAALLINNSADIIGVIDSETLQIEEINTAFTDILGYSRKEAEGSALTFFLSADDRALVQNLSKQDAQRLSFETRIYCKDKNIKWVHWKIVVKDGKWYVNARDITEVKETEQIRNYLAAVVKQSNEAIYIHDQEGKIICWNTGAEKIYGYPEKEAIKMKIWDIIPLYMQPETKELIRKILNGDNIQGFETKRLTRSEKILDVLLSASTISGTRNDQVLIAITENDISHQKIIIEEIKESEARFRNLFDNAPYPMWVYDLDSLRFMEVNQTAISLYGYSREQFLSMKITDIRPKEEVPRLLENIATSNHQIQQPGEWVHRLHNGELIDVEITSHLLEFNGRKAPLVIAVNITGIKKAAARFKQKNEELESVNKRLQMFASLVESSFNFVSMANMQGKVFYLNRAARLLMGLNVDEDFPKDMDAYCDPATVELIKEEGMPAVIEKGWWEGTGKLHNFRTGKLWDSEMRAFMVKDPVTGVPLCMAAINSDITARNKAAEEIRQLNLDLKMNVQRLENINKELESFSYSVSHDLRAPLRALNGFSKMIEEDYSEILDEEGKRLLGNIQFNALRMGRLIDDLLAFSGLGRKKMEKSLINIEEIVREVLNEINTSEQHHASIKMNFLPDAYADYPLIRQVWSNLISNAIKYSGKKENPEIEIGSTACESEIIYYVKDNGTGFNMKYADKLFGVFQRLHNPNEFEGSGIGLAIVHRIITRHGGRVWAESEVDKGSAFYFTLPNTISGNIN